MQDKFHIAKYLNDSVDKVRRRENQVLRESEDTRLTGTKELWFYAKRSLSRKRQKEIRELQDADLKLPALGLRRRTFVGSGAMFMRLLLKGFSIRGMRW